MTAPRTWASALRARSAIISVWSLTEERVGDLFGGRHQPARGVDDQVNGHLRWRQADRPQGCLAVLDVDVAGQRHPQEARRLQTLLPAERRPSVSLSARQLSRW
jgi:hypothetical protein